MNKKYITILSYTVHQSIITRFNNRFNHGLLRRHYNNGIIEKLKFKKNIVESFAYTNNIHCY